MCVCDFLFLLPTADHIHTAINTLENAIIAYGQEWSGRVESLGVFLVRFLSGLSLVVTIAFAFIIVAVRCRHLAPSPAFVIIIFLCFCFIATYYFLFCFFQLFFFLLSAFFVCFRSSLRYLSFRDPHHPILTLIIITIVFTFLFSLPRSFPSPFLSSLSSTELQQ